MSNTRAPKAAREAAEALNELIDTDPEFERLFQEDGPVTVLAAINHVLERQCQAGLAKAVNTDGTLSGFTPARQRITPTILNSNDQHGE